MKPKLWMVSFAIFDMTILSNQKLKNVKYRFWLQKEVKIHIQYVFPIRDPPNCRWFHLLILTRDHFIKPKIEKRKIPFLVTKRGQNS